MLNGAREMTPEEKAYVEGLVMQSYDRFVGIVAKARKSRRAKPARWRCGWPDLERDGRLRGKTCQSTRLYRGRLCKGRELAGAPGARIVRYKRAITLASLLRMFSETKAPSIKVDILEKIPPP